MLSRESIALSPLFCNRTGQIFLSPESAGLSIIFRINVLSHPGNACYNEREDCRSCKTGGADKNALEGLMKEISRVDGLKIDYIGGGARGGARGFM